MRNFQFKTHFMSFYKKLKSLILLILIINGLAIGRVAIKEYREYNSDKLDLAEKLHKRYAPLLELVGSENRLGIIIEMNKTEILFEMNKNEILDNARFPILRYMLAPRSLVRLPDSEKIFSERQDGDMKRDSSGFPKIVIYEGPLNIEFLKQYVVLKKINETLYVLEKI